MTHGITLLVVPYIASFQYSGLITIISQINANKNVTTIKSKVFCFSLSFS